MLPEELEGQVGVGDDRASLLSDGLVYHAGAFDVACLSFAYAEDVGDALDAMHEARCVVCRLAAAAEGFLYGLVDNLCELSYGEVNDSGVLMYHVFCCLLCIAVCLLSLVLGCSCSVPGWEGLAPLCVLCLCAPRLTTLVDNG